MAGSKGIDRRTLIKGAAVAGAAAWTAPMIIDSLASPAAAGTPGPCVKNYYARINFTGCANIGGGNQCFSPSGVLGCDVSPGGNPCDRHLQLRLLHPHVAGRLHLHGKFRRRAVRGRELPHDHGVSHVLGRIGVGERMLQRGRPGRLRHHGTVLARRHRVLLSVLVRP